MTARVLLLGNSHVAAPLDALKIDPEGWPGMDISAVAAQGNVLLETRLDGPRLIPDSARARAAFDRFGGRADMDLSTFDALIVVGCGMTIGWLTRLYQHLRWPDLPSLADVEDLARMKPLLVSRRMAETALSQPLRDGLGGVLAGRLAEAVETPVYVASQPRWNVSVLTDGSVRAFTCGTALRSGDAPLLSDMFDRVARRTVAGRGARWLPQPAATVDRHLTTGEAYVTGAMRLTVDSRKPQPTDDILHANAAYGAALLDQIADTLAA